MECVARFDVVLMDADDTLLDYPADARAALAGALERFGYSWSPEAEEEYQRYNQAAWRRFERGEITKPELQIVRFEQFFAAWGITADPAEFNRVYMKGLSEGGRVLPGARELCEALARQVSLYIVTNGAAETQGGRFARSGLLPYLKKVYMSETVGYQKPRKEYFDCVLADVERLQGPVCRERVIVFGDSLASDMQGGINAGLTTCWYNPDGRDAGGLPIDYTVRDHQAFRELVLG